MGSLLGQRSYHLAAVTATENPYSQGDHWINGGTTGLDWQDVQSAPGLIFGTGTSPAPPYNDPTAILAGLWGKVQTVEATVTVPASPSGSQEVELRLLSAVGAHINTGYEVLFSVTSNPYVAIEVWHSGTDTSTFTEIALASGPQLVTGYRVKASVSAAGLIKAYVDSGGGYSSICSATDTTYVTGAPGLGFFQSGSTAAMSAFGFSAFTARSA